MRTIKLTKKLLKELKPYEIIYAEYAGFGAKGEAASARIYAYQEGKMNFYLVRAEDENKGVLDATVQFLNEGVENGFLLSEDAGFGNKALKNIAMQFKTSDSDHAFIFPIDGKVYKMETSVLGVYAEVAPKFAVRDITSGMVNEYVDNSEGKFTYADFTVMMLMRNQLERMENGMIWFSFSPYDYSNALAFIQNEAGAEIITDEEWWQDTWIAIWKYRLAYAVENLGWNKVEEIFAEMIKDEEFDIVQRLSNELGEDLGEVYDPMESVSIDQRLNEIEDNARAEVELQGYNEVQTFLMLMRRVFEKPVLVEFTRQQRKGAIEKMMEATSDDLVKDGEGLAKFVVNFIAHEDKWSYVDILPLMKHVLKVVPSFGLENTRMDQIFWLCNDVLERCWKAISEDDGVQKRFRDLMYEIHWPRVGSVWPIVHTGDFKLEDSVANDMLIESINYIMSLKDIAERNPALGKLLEKEAKAWEKGDPKIDIGYGVIGKSELGYPMDRTGLWRRAVEYRLEKMSPKKRFETVLKDTKPDWWSGFLNFPETNVEADLVLNAIVRDDENAPFQEETRLDMLGFLLNSPNSEGVGKHIIGFVADNLPKIVELMTNEGIYEEEEEGEKSRRAKIAETLFLAAAKGVTEESELEPLKRMKEAAIKLGAEAKKMNKAEKYAIKHQKMVAFQRAEVTPLFEK